jgi:hypothetical protein
MSSIGSIGSSVGGYAALQRPQPPSKEALFKRADADGSGGVDASELQKMLAHHPGGGSAVDFSRLDSDSDGSGSLDATELDTAMKSLMPKPSSTVEFAQQRGGQDDDLFSKVDANGDGGDAAEATAMQDALTQALQSATSSDASSGSGSATSSDQNNALQQQAARLAELLVQQYASVGTYNGSALASTGTQVNVTA